MERSKHLKSGDLESQIMHKIFELGILIGRSRRATQPIQDTYKPIGVMDKKYFELFFHLDSNKLQKMREELQTKKAV